MKILYLQVSPTVKKNIGMISSMISGFHLVFVIVYKRRLLLNWPAVCSSALKTRPRRGQEPPMRPLGMTGPLRNPQYRNWLLQDLWGWLTGSSADVSTCRQLHHPQAGLWQGLLCARGGGHAEQHPGDSEGLQLLGGAVQRHLVRCADRPGSEPGGRPNPGAWGNSLVSQCDDGRPWRIRERTQVRVEEKQNLTYNDARYPHPKGN